MKAPAPTASAIGPRITYHPGEKLGAFTERFAEIAKGKPIELVAVVAWRLCERAFLDGLEAAPAHRAEAELCQPGEGSDRGC